MNTGILYLAIAFWVGPALCLEPIDLLDHSPRYSVSVTGISRLGVRNGTSLVMTADQVVFRDLTKKAEVHHNKFEVVVNEVAGCGLAASKAIEGGKLTILARSVSPLGEPMTGVLVHDTQNLLCTWER